MKILVVAEIEDGQFKAVNQHVLSAANQLNGKVDLLLAGNLSEELIQQARQFSLLHQVMIVQSENYTHYLAENFSALIADVAKSYDFVLMAATANGKNCLPRVAALLNVSMLSDVVAILSPDTFVRPMYAGNVLATVKTNEKIKLLTIRATGFSPVLPEQSFQAVTIMLEKEIPNTLSTFISETRHESTRPELTSARIVLSGGRGMKSAENFNLLEKIADKLGAAIGASRAAVDAGFAPNDWQVGQTGKIVAPDLYIAVGISGAIQHLAGMKDSKVIVAINSDAEAPMCAAADYVLVGDLFKILPELDNALAS